MANRFGVTHWLLGLCGLLAVTIGSEWVYVNGALDQLRLEMDKPVKPNVRLGKTDRPRFQPPAKERFSVIVEHPLMVMGRQPVADAGSFQIAQAGQQGNFPIKVMGIVMTPSILSVLVKDSKDAYHRLKVNETVDGWTLVEVQADWIVMKRGDVRRQLKLLKPRPINSNRSINRQRKVNRQSNLVKSLKSKEPVVVGKTKKSEALARPEPPKLDDLAW